MKRKVLTIATIAMMTATTSVPTFANTRVSNLKVIDLDTYNFDGPTVGDDAISDEMQVEQSVTEASLIAEPSSEIPITQEFNALALDGYGYTADMTAAVTDTGNYTMDTPVGASANNPAIAIADATAADSTEETSFPESESIPGLFPAITENAYNAGRAFMAIASAFQKLGSPYSQARRDSGRAYDCSSMVYYSYRAAGIDLGYNGSNTAASICQGLVAKGKEIALNNLEAGDLLFYSKHKDNGRFRRISHVAMYIGNGELIHASSSKGKVVKSNLFTSGLTSVCRPSL